MIKRVLLALRPFLVSGIFLVVLFSVVNFTLFPTQPSSNNEQSFFTQASKICSDATISIREGESEEVVSEEALSDLNALTLPPEESSKLEAQRWLEVVAKALQGQVSFAELEASSSSFGFGSCGVNGWPNLEKI